MKMWRKGGDKCKFWSPQQLTGLINHMTDICFFSLQFSVHWSRRSHSAYPLVRGAPFTARDAMFRLLPLRLSPAPADFLLRESVASVTEAAQRPALTGPWARARSQRWCNGARCRGVHALQTEFPVSVLILFVRRVFVVLQQNSVCPATLLHQRGFFCSLRICQMAPE